MALVRPREQLRYRWQLYVPNVFTSCLGRRTRNQTFNVPVETGRPQNFKDRHTMRMGSMGRNSPGRRPVSDHARFLSADSSRKKPQKHVKNNRPRRDEAAGPSIAEVTDTRVSDPVTRSEGTERPAPNGARWGRAEQSHQLNRRARWPGCSVPCGATESPTDRNRSR